MIKKDVTHLFCFVADFVDEYIAAMESRALDEVSKARKPTRAPGLADAESEKGELINAAITRVDTDDRTPVPELAKQFLVYCVATKVTYQNLCLRGRNCFIGTPH